MPSQCKRCNDEITFAKSMTRPDSWIPLDRYPDPGAGCVRKRFAEENGRQVVYGQVLTGTTLYEALADGEHLYACHRDTCTGSRPRTTKPAHIKLDIRPIATKRSHP